MGISIMFDTLKFSKRLTSAGLSPEVAEELAEAHKEILEECLSTNVATKDDIHRLDGKFLLLQWMIGFLLAFNIAILFKLFL